MRMTLVRVIKLRDTTCGALLARPLDRIIAIPLCCNRQPARAFTLTPFRADALRGVRSRRFAPALVRRFASDPPGVVRRTAAVRRRSSRGSGKTGAVLVAALDG